MVFADIAIGDQLVQRSIHYVEAPIDDGGAPPDKDFLSLQAHPRTRYAIVKDVGKHSDDAPNALSDKTMVTLRWLQTGTEIGEPFTLSLFALAANAWSYSDRDELAYWTNIRNSLAEGKLVGIGRAKRHHT